MPNKKVHPLKKHLVCKRCGADWDYGGTTTRTPCPFCGFVKDARDRSEYTKCYGKATQRKDRLKRWYADTENRKARGVKQRGLLRKRVFFKISGSINPKCVRCGCDDARLLEINHKNGGGGRESQRGKLSARIYHDIAMGRRNVSDLEVLCKPCNGIHALELKYGPLPMRVMWQPSASSTLTV